MTYLFHTEKLSVRRGNKNICENLNLQIRPGEVWGVIGPNGSGKTTLLTTLAGLIIPHMGGIFLGEKKISNFSPRSLAQKRAILFQDTHDIFSQTVWEFCEDSRYSHLNITGKNSDGHKIIREALQVVGLAHYASHSLQSLSGGERRRLAVAAILVQSPILYLLDEPTNHLDLHFQIKVLEHFKQLAKQEAVAILMSLHDINLATHYCEFILMLCGDGTVLQGVPEEIFSKENLERVYQCVFQSVKVDQRHVWLPYLKP